MWEYWKPVLGIESATAAAHHSDIPAFQYSKPSRLLLPAACLLLAIVAPAAAAAAPADGLSGGEREQALIAALVADDADWQDKDAACRELQIIGTRACIPALEGLLADPVLSHAARCVLEPMPDPEAGAALRRALEQTEGLTQIGIIHSLAVRRDADAAPALEDLLTFADPAVSAAAAAALGAIGTPEAAEALARLRAAPADAVMRNAAAEGSLLAAERLLAQGLHEASASICRDLHGADWPPGIRLAAFVGLLEADAPNAVQHILDAMADDNPHLRAAAIAQVAALPGDDTAQRFATELTHLPAEMQVLLLGALQRRGSGDARDAILTLGRTSDDEAVRIACCGALGAVGDAGGVPWLADRASNANVAKAERDAASLALLQIRAPGVPAALIRAMEDASPTARPALINLLAERQETDSVPALLHQAGAAETDVRKAAARALGMVAAPATLPELLALLRNAPGENPDLEQAVARIAHKIGNDTRADPVLAALAAAREPAVRASLLRVLGDIGGERALAAVEDALDADDPTVADAAVRALASWPDATAVDTLAAICRTASDPGRRIAALRGLVRVAGLPADRPAAQTASLYRQAAENATTPAERKLLLSGLARVPHPDALAMAIASLSDEETRSEAAFAAIAIAEQILPAHPEAAAEAMRQLADTNIPAAASQRAAALLEMEAGFKDFMLSWEFSGPYRDDRVNDEALLDTPFAPETADGPAPAWRTLPLRIAPGKPGMLDLADAIGGEHCVAYARTWLHADAATPAELLIGVDDTIKVWLNAELLHKNATPGAAIADEEQVPISLQPGWNLLLLKIVQFTGPWEFCARLQNPDGNPLPHVRADAHPEF